MAAAARANGDNLASARGFGDTIGELAGDVPGAEDSPAKSFSAHGRRSIHSEPLRKNLSADQPAPNPPLVSVYYIKRCADPNTTLAGPYYHLLAYYVGLTRRFDLTIVPARLTASEGWITGNAVKV